MQTLRDEAPLVVTAALSTESFAVLDGLRLRHFPAALNKVPAHVSLFHHLPAASAEIVLADIRDRCNGSAAFDLRPLGLRFLGRGVAIDYEAGDLTPLRNALARSWKPWLTAQDRQPFKPHVTIQNKVTPEAAWHLHAFMAFEPLPTARIEGIAVWRYLGGPWEALATCLFVQKGATTA